MKTMTPFSQTIRGSSNPIGVTLEEIAFQIADIHAKDSQIILDKSENIVCDSASFVVTDLIPQRTSRSHVNVAAGLMLSLHISFNLDIDFWSRFIVFLHERNHYAK